jgi:sulfur transfer complex TusBCD TusB component (DsrH family)
MANRNPFLKEARALSDHEPAEMFAPKGDVTARGETQTMSKNRELFDEMMSGIDAMRKQREGKITLRTHEVNELLYPDA